MKNRVSNEQRRYEDYITGLKDKIKNQEETIYES